MPLPSAPRGNWEQDHAVPDRFARSLRAIGAIREDVRHCVRCGTLVHGEYLASGQAALRNVGVTDPAAFEAWARANRPEDVSSAVRDMLTGRSVNRLQSLGRAFVAQNNEKLASLIQSHGVDAEVRDGQVFVSRKGLGLPPSPKVGDFGGSDSISLRDAIRAGYISFNN